MKNSMKVALKTVIVSFGENKMVCEVQMKSVPLDKYLTIVEVRKTVKTLTLFCDSCSVQNKNNVVFAAIFWFMNKKANNINKVSITYLQPGHTYMPVDSVHSTIESN